MRLVSETVCGWHVRILLRIPVARILWDFDFLRGLAPGRLDGFSIGRYEKKRESFDLYVAKFENGARRFWGEKSPGAGTLSKQGFLPCLSIIKNNQQRTQIHSKGRLDTTGKVTPRLFIIDLHTQLAIYGYR